MITKTLKTILFSGLILTSAILFHIDESTIVNGMLVEKSERAGIDQTESNETIKETFIITSVDNGIIRGELLNDSGEGIYYNLNELDMSERGIFSKLDVNDLIRIEWTKENYDSNEWYEIENVLFNQSNDNDMKEGI